jgi:hypothetical protein
VRDRLLWALLAESGGLVKRGPRAPTPTGADPACDDLVVIDLVTRARKSDKQAWDALVERYSALIWSICRGTSWATPTPSIRQKIAKATECRSARLQRTGPKGSFQYRTAGRGADRVSLASTLSGVRLNGHAGQGRSVGAAGCRSPSARGPTPVIQPRLPQCRLTRRAQEGAAGSAGRT